MVATCTKTITEEILCNKVIEAWEQKILFKSHSIVWVNWNGFPSIFQKVQYFHSRH